MICVTAVRRGNDDIVGAKNKKEVKMTRKFRVVFDDYSSETLELPEDSRLATLTPAFSRRAIREAARKSGKRLPKKKIVDFHLEAEK